MENGLSLAEHDRGASDVDPIAAPVERIDETVEVDEESFARCDLP
jgi:hypothetical protein